MTLKHKIKLIWARFNWWLSFTERSKKYAEKSFELSLIEEKLKEKQEKYNEAHKQNENSDMTKILLIEIRLLGELLR